MISLASRRSINTPKTPRRQPTGSRLSASPLATRTHLPTPARSGANDAPPSSQTNTPAKSRTGMSLTSEIWREHERDLAGEDASREKARIQAEARWERQRQAAAMREEMDEEEELDFDLQFLYVEAASRLLTSTAILFQSLPLKPLMRRRSSLRMGEGVHLVVVLPAPSPLPRSLIARNRRG